MPKREKDSLVQGFKVKRGTSTLVLVAILSPMIVFCECDSQQNDAPAMPTLYTEMNHPLSGNLMFHMQMVEEGDGEKVLYAFLIEFDLNDPTALFPAMDKPERSKAISTIQHKVQLTEGLVIDTSYVTDVPVDLVIHGKTYDLQDGRLFLLKPHGAVGSVAQHAMPSCTFEEALKHVRRLAEREEHASREARTEDPASVPSD